MSVKTLIKLAKRLQIKYGSSRLEVPLFGDKGIFGDDLIDYRYSKNQEIINFFPKLWAPEYQEQFASYVKGAIQRGEEEIRDRYDSIRHGKHDIVLTLKRVLAQGVHLRGDMRYSSDDLAKYLLDTEYDLVPCIVGSSGMGEHLLDGHHRWRAYLIAGLSPLVLEIKVEPSKDDMPKCIAIVDSSALNKK
jgi:hypothetical protein